MDTVLKLGAAKIDITPLKSIPLAGFAHRKKGFEDVSQPLYARIHCFEQENAAGTKVSVLVVAADLIWWGTDLVNKLTPQLKKKWGFQSVILHATHTHSGPQTSRLFTESLGKADDEYLEFLQERLMQGIEQALRTVEPVSIHRGGGTCRIGVNRRKATDGQISMAPNEEGPVDSEVTVIRFQNREGKVKGVIIHYTCHPTTTDDNDVSSEFPGAAVDRVEHALGGGAVGAFLQGCCGDVRPFLVADEEFYRGHRAEVEHFGRLLSEEVLRINDRPMEELQPTMLTSRTSEVRLAFQSVPERAELERMAAMPDIEGEWARLLLVQPQRIQASIPLEMTLLKVAKELSFITFNAEMVSAYGLYTKRKFRGSVLPLAYTNGMIGYVPTGEQIFEGGYEARDSVPYFGLPSAFAPHIEDDILHAIDDFIREEDGNE